MLDAGETTDRTAPLNVADGRLTGGDGAGIHPDKATNAAAGSNDCGNAGAQIAGADGGEILPDQAAHRADTTHRACCRAETDGSRIGITDQAACGCPLAGDATGR